MKKPILLGLCCLMFATHARAQSAAPSENMMIAGFKQALSIGAEKAVQMVSKQDGYFGNQAIKILLPEKMKPVAGVLAKGACRSKSMRLRTA